MSGVTVISLSAGSSSLNRVILSSDQVSGVEIAGGDSGTERTGTERREFGILYRAVGSTRGGRGGGSQGLSGDSEGNFNLQSFV